MKIWLIRAAWLVGLLALGWLLHFVLAPLGYAWVVWTLAGITVGFLLLELVLRTRKRGKERSDWARWRAALPDARTRREAIGELQRGIDRARRLAARGRVRHARLAVLLAELLEAEGRSEKAIQALAKIQVRDLEEIQAAIIRQARIQAYLHAGDTDGAAAALSALPEQTGDAVIDVAVELSRGAVALEEGELEEAEQHADAVAERTEPHDELWDDARALRLLVHVANGEHADAKRAWDEIRAPGQTRLRLIGSARLRTWIEGTRG